MIWEELTKLEPKLLEVEAWIKSLNPNDPDYWEEAAYIEMKKRMNPLVGWFREVPGYEHVPFEPTGPSYYSLGELAEHDVLYQNKQRKKAMMAKLSEEEKYLYTSPAWEVAWQHLYDLLPEEKER